MIYAVAWHHDIYYYCWQSAGVGNFTDDIVLLVFLGYFGKKVWTTVKRKLDRNHHALMALHLHHGTGYEVPDHLSD